MTYSAKDWRKVLCSSLLLICVTLSCKTDIKPKYVEISGKTMGTTYSLKWLTDQDPNRVQREIDSLLVGLNQNLSTYIPSSFISQINSSSDGDILESSDQFWINLDRSLKWHDLSIGYFDPSVMPLVNYWGFGYEPKRAVEKIDSLKIDSILTFVGLDKWQINTELRRIFKPDYRQQLDFSALAKGYGVDMIADFLEKDSSFNYLVDIGGEMRARGVNSSGRTWVVGINQPIAGSRNQDVSELLQLDNIALATSGNYRNYHEVNGTKYGHTISPLTGFPFQDRLLSVTIATEKCMDADAIATACMAMGLDKARTFIENLEGVDACFLAGTNKGTIETIYSDGFIRHTYRPRPESEQ